MPTVEATEEAARSSLGWPFFRQATLYAPAHTQTAHAGAQALPTPLPCMAVC